MLAGIVKPHRLEVTLRELLLCSLLLAAPYASADSFCNYETGLIGTPGVGFLAPHRVEHAKYSYQDKRCEVPIFSAPNGNAPDFIDCANIEEFPSEYNELLFENDPIFQSEYFAFLVFEWSDEFARINLKSGESGWVKTNYASVRDKFDPENVIGWRGLRSSEHVYGAPDFEQIASKPNINGPIANSYLRRAFEFADVPFEIAKDPWNWFFETSRSGDFYFDFSYHVIDLVEGRGGALWYVAEEHLAIDVLIREELRDELNVVLGEAIEGIYYSPMIRTIYLPYRDEHGIVQSVFLRGPYCD